MNYFQSSYKNYEFDSFLCQWYNAVTKTSIKILCTFYNTIYQVIICFISDSAGHNITRWSLILFTAFTPLTQLLNSTLFRKVKKTRWEEKISMKKKSFKLGLVPKLIIAIILGILWKVFLVVILMHLICIFIQFCIAGAVSKKNPFTLIKNQIPGYATALGTQSSAATIPVNLQCAEAE